MFLDLEIPFTKRDALDFEFVPVFFGTEAYHVKRFSTDQRFFVFYFSIFDATVRDTLLIVYQKNIPKYKLGCSPWYLPVIKKEPLA